MRLPRDLLAAVKKQAERRGLPYQRYIRETPASGWTLVLAP